MRVNNNTRIKHEDRFFSQKERDKKMRNRILLMLCFLIALTVISENIGVADDEQPKIKAEYVTYGLDNGHVYRIQVKKKAKPKDISKALNKLSKGTSDGRLNISPNGVWLILETDRFDAVGTGEPSLAIVTGNLKKGESVLSEGELIHPAGFGAVSSDGNLIVYPGGDGPHSRDLWAVVRNGENWGKPLLLTGDSTYQWNDQVAISDDGSKVLFDGGDEPYGAEGTAICEVGTDGTGFRVVITPADSPDGYPDTGALHHADYAPDGSIVFEADWSGERIWRLPAGDTEPVLVGDFGNDNSPCVLPDGRIVSLWLDRQDNVNSLHEIKVMSPDGGTFMMLSIKKDVLDSGIGCGGK